jgi:hypothetical protein
MRDVFYHLLKSRVRYVVDRKKEVDIMRYQVFFNQKLYGGRNFRWG